MTREPFRLGGSPVNNIKGMKKYPAGMQEEATGPHRKTSMCRAGSVGQLAEPSSAG